MTRHYYTPAVDELDEGGEFDLTPEEQAALRQALGALGRGPNTQGAPADTRSQGLSPDDVLNDLLSQYARTKAQLDDIDGAMAGAEDAGTRYYLSNQRTTLTNTLTKLVSSINAARKAGANSAGPRVFNLGGGRLVAVDQDLSVRDISSGSTAPPARQIGKSLVERNPSTGAWDVVYREPETTTPKAPSIQIRGRDVLAIDPWTAAVTSSYQLPPEEITPYQQAALDQQQENSRLAAIKADQDREAENMRQGMTNYTSAWNQALAYQLPEGTEYIPLLEPGGPMQKLYERYNMPFNPVRATRVPFDPWQAAVNMMGGGQQRTR